MNKYTIAYKGFKDGKHRFDFTIDDVFFNAFEDSAIKGGDCRAEVLMNKSASMLGLTINIDGEVKVECDRCLDEFMMPIHYEGTLTVKFSETEDDTDGEVMWISPADGELKLGQYFYESIALSLPYHRVHADMADCNKDMLERFKIVSQEEFDTLTAPHEAIERMTEVEKLKELKHKLENKN